MNTSNISDEWFTVFTVNSFKWIIGAEEKKTEAVPSVLFVFLFYVSYHLENKHIIILVPNPVEIELVDQVCWGCHGWKKILLCTTLN
jgi:hypothetical protein